MELLNANVKHKVFGTGKIVEITDKNILVVDFATRTSKFQFPDCFVTFLTAEDAVLQEEILIAIDEKKKAIEEEKRKKEEADRLAEEARKAAEKATLSKHKSTSEKAAHIFTRETGKPMTFYVFQGGTFKIESTGGYVWAPVYSQGGTTQFYWENIMNIRKGDIILSGFDGKIAAVSIAISDGYNSKRPKERTFEESWTEDGYRADLEYTVIANPISTIDCKSEILKYCRVKYSPFNQLGTGNMGYLYELHKDLAKIFIEETIKKNPDIYDLDYIKQFLSE